MATGHHRTLRMVDAEAVGALAARIWRQCYPGIIPEAQIEFMLARMYSAEVIRAELSRGVGWEWWVVDGNPAGFLSWEGPDAAGWMRLHRLYLDPVHHGRGEGQAMLARVEEIRVNRGAIGVELRVNRANHRAIRAYQRAGYHVAEDRCDAIGGGFLMDDHVMRRSG